MKYIILIFVMVCPLLHANYEVDEDGLIRKIIQTDKKLESRKLADLKSSEQAVIKKYLDDWGNREYSDKYIFTREESGLKGILILHVGNDGFATLSLFVENSKTGHFYQGVAMSDLRYIHVAVSTLKKEPRYRLFEDINSDGVPEVTLPDFSHNGTAYQGILKYYFFLDLKNERIDKLLAIEEFSGDGYLRVVRKVVGRSKNKITVEVDTLKQNKRQIFSVDLSHKTISKSSIEQFIISDEWPDSFLFSGRSTYSKIVHLNNENKMDLSSENGE